MLKLIYKINCTNYRKPNIHYKLKWKPASKLQQNVWISGSVQSKGACLVPKRGLDVMNGEVNRVLQLTSNAIIPITYQVPRKVSLLYLCKCNIKICIF